MSGLPLNVETETSKQACNTTREEDGFFTTLAALRQVLTPTNTQQQSVVQLLQKEKRDLIKEMESIREDAHAQQQLKLSAQEAGARNEARLQHAEERIKWQQSLVQQEERANARYKELEVELTHYGMLVAEVRHEKEQAVQQIEDENQRLTDSMIQLESENKTLQERCEQVEMTSHKLQTELNDRTTASEQSNVALSKMGKVLQQKESSTAEIVKYKQKMNEALSTASELQYKLQQAERELSSLVTFKMEQEQTQKVESNVLSRVVLDEDTTTTNKLATTLEQQEELAETTSAYTILQQQRNEETALLQSKLAAKDALLEAKDKMLVAFKSKLEKLQDKAKQVEAKHAVEIIQIKEEWQETRDELTCAEAEVRRGRTRIQELESSRVLDPSNTSKEMDNKSILVAPHTVADTMVAEEKAKQLESAVVEPAPGESQAHVQKRKAEEHKDTDASSEELDSIKAKLFAKKQKSQQQQQRTTKS